MKTVISFLFLSFKIAVISLGLTIGLIQISPYFLTGYEPQVEDWFEQQGFTAEIDNIAISFQGYHPQIELRGLQLKESGKDSQINLDKASLFIDSFDSFSKRQLSFTHAAFFLKKVIINLDGDDQTSFTLEQLLSSSGAHLALSLKQFSLTIDQLVLLQGQTQYEINNTSVIVSDQNRNKRIHINSGLYQSNTVLKSQFDIDLATLINKQQVKGTGYLKADIADLAKTKSIIDTDLKGDLQIQQWIEFDQLNFVLKTQLMSKNLGFEWQTQAHKTAMNVQFINEINGHNLETFVAVNELELDNYKFSPFSLAIQSLVKDVEFSQIKLNSADFAFNDLKQIMTLLSPSNDVNQSLESINLSGDLKSIYVQIPDLNKPEAISYQLQADNLTWSAYQDIPAINKIHADVAGNSQQFKAKLKSDSVVMDLPDYFTKPLDMTDFSTEVYGEIYQDAMEIEIEEFVAQSNDAKFEGRAEIDFEGDTSPYLFVNLRTAGLGLEQVKSVLPEKAIDVDTLTWINDSIKAAELTKAVLYFSGRVDSEIDFNDENTELLAELDIENLDLKYDPEWPLLQASHSKLTFKNRSFVVTAPTAQTDKIKLQNIHFEIKDLLNSAASISLVVKDSIKDQWHFLAQTPIKPEIPYYSSISDLSGRSITKVNAAFYLEANREADTTFNVAVNAKKGAFKLDEWAVAISDLDGVINISDNALSMKLAKAKWYDQEVLLSFISDDKNPTKIQMRGEQLSVDSLTHLVPLKMDDYFAGKSDWLINLDIQTEDELKPIVKVDAVSSLNGYEVQLPTPLYKAKQKKERVDLSIDVFNDAIDISVNWQDKLQIEGALDKQQDQFQLTAANVLLGEGKNTGELKSGVVVNGEIDELNIDGWLDILSAENAENEQAKGKNVSPIQLIKSVDLFADNLQLFGAPAESTHLKMTKNEKGLKGIINSSMADGQFLIPTNQLKKQAIQIDMEKINIQFPKESDDETKEDVEKDYKTDQFPSLNFAVKDLTVNDKHFKNVAFNLVTDIKNLLELQTLTISHNDITLNASGAWSFDAKTGEHLSNLFIDIDGANLGQTLLELGVGDVIENGAVAFQSELFWTKPFWDVDFNIATGSGSIRIDNGYLKDIEPGGGRFVGLLSLSALPRRLTLDFSDFFKEGLEFDKISGDFSIHDGSMWTENLKMRGSVSEVRINGRTGIVEQDYDQLLTIVPQVSDALPVFSSLVAGSSVGWAMLLFQKLFEKPIDQSVTIKYKVSGNWDSPQIDLIEEPPVENKENNDSNS